MYLKLQKLVKRRNHLVSRIEQTFELHVMLILTILIVNLNINNSTDCVKYSLHIIQF